MLCSPEVSKEYSRHTVSTQFDCLLHERRACCPAAAISHVGTTSLYGTAQASTTEFG